MPKKLSAHRATAIMALAAQLQALSLIQRVRGELYDRGTPGKLTTGAAKIALGLAKKAFPGIRPEVFDRAASYLLSEPGAHSFDWRVVRSVFEEAMADPLDGRSY